MTEPHPQPVRAPAPDEEKCMPERLVCVDAPHFCAGLVFDGDICVRAAPILKYCHMKNAQWCSQYFRRKGWKATQRPILAEPKDPRP